MEVKKKCVSLRSQNGRTGSPGGSFRGKKFIENIEKTSSKIQETEFLQSVNSFGNKEKNRVTGASNLNRIYTMKSLILAQDER